VSYQVVSRFAEEIRVQAEIQQQIQFTQEGEVLRPLRDYQNMLQEVKNG